MNHRPQDYRDKVAAAYEKAIAPDGGESLVQGTGGGKFADYGEEELRALPAEAIDASFGCGNPIAFAGVRLGETVLDLGSGAGLDLMLAAERVGSSGKVIGVDMTDAMIERARATIASGGYPNVEVRKGLIEELPVDSNSVDWVISNCVINLATDKAKVFAEIARVLKPGGRMLVSDIVAHDLPWWVRRSGLLAIACAGGAISEDAYLDGLRNASLENVSVIARQYYEPVQMASVVTDSLPKALRDIRCCGISVATAVLANVARPIATRLYSAKVYAEKPLNQ